VRHVHHIIPRHRGGSDDPSNLIELSITQHAMWHFADWQLTQTPENFIAWRSLAGIISKEQAVFEAQSLGGKRAITKTQEWWMNQAPERRSQVASRGGKVGGRTNALSGHCARIAGLGGKAAAGKGAKNSNAQRWKCLETGHISNPGGLSRFQKKRGIDTSLRVRVD
jgi:hypothetical protein